MVLKISFRPRGALMSPNTLLQSTVSVSQTRLASVGSWNAQSKHTRHKLRCGIGSVFKRTYLYSLRNIRRSVDTQSFATPVRSRTGPGKYAQHA
jgi:hypothetical protein